MFAHIFVWTSRTDHEKKTAVKVYNRIRQKTFVDVDVTLLHRRRIISSSQHHPMKLWNNFHAPEDIEPALDESLTALDTEYLDLYLIHWCARTLHIIGRLCSLLFNRPIAQKQGPTPLYYR